MMCVTDRSTSTGLFNDRSTSTGLFNDRSTSTGLFNDRSTFTSINVRTTDLRHCFFFANLLPLGVCVCFAKAQALPPQSFQIITKVG
jgi:hypothetical protein